MRAALHPLTTTSPAYSPAAPAVTSLCAYQTFPTTHPPAQRNQPRRRTDIWRTEDQQPICYYCHTPGHILRYCRRRLHDAGYHRSTFGRTLRTDGPDDSAVFPESRTTDGPTLPRLPTRRSPTYEDNDRPSTRRSQSPVFTSQSRRGRSLSPYPIRRRSISPLNDAAPSTSPPSN